MYCGGHGKLFIEEGRLHLIWVWISKVHTVTTSSRTCHFLKVLTPIGYEKPILYFSLFATFLSFFLPAKMYSIVTDIWARSEEQRYRLTPSSFSVLLMTTSSQNRSLSHAPEKRNANPVWWGGKNRVRTNANQYLNKSICELLEEWLWAIRSWWTRLLYLDILKSGKNEKET